jgi:hypothetical protein
LILGQIKRADGFESSSTTTSWGGASFEDVIFVDEEKDLEEIDVFSLMVDWRVRREVGKKRRKSFSETQLS